MTILLPGEQSIVNFVLSSTSKIHGLSALLLLFSLVIIFAFFIETDDVTIAIEREKQIKKWRRRKKIELIKSFNEKWEDLSKDWFDGLE